MDECDAHVYCVSPWLWVTDYEIFFIIMISNVCTGSPVDIVDANSVHSESQWSNTNLNVFNSRIIRIKRGLCSAGCRELRGTRRETGPFPARTPLV